MDEKASGLDEIPSEILKLGGDELHIRLCELILQIHDAGVILEDFKKNIIIPIPQKVGEVNCRLDIDYIS